MQMKFTKDVATEDSVKSLNNATEVVGGWRISTPLPDLRMPSFLLKGSLLF